ncbi:hypothetical protein [Saccharothrix sp. HUAS TT1]|uniref:hypothetical protein n=1 Tax=unclassified Saccharothrix TaxID=2593673 RepID=UPI00345B88A7
MMPGAGGTAVVDPVVAGPAEVDAGRDRTAVWIEGLREFLSFAVPLMIAHTRGWDATRRREVAARDAATIASCGDALQFPGRDARARQRTASAATALARGTALLAHEPGGVIRYGIHWCAALHPGGVVADPGTAHRHSIAARAARPATVSAGGAASTPRAAPGGGR